MALEGILKGITKSPGSSEPNNSYTPERLTETSDFIQEFSQIDTSTSEGLDKYKKTTGLPTKGQSSAKINLTYRQIGAELDERFTGYVNSHIRPITGEISERIQASIAYSFCPIEESTSKKYETARKSIHTAKKTIESIENNPEEHIKKIIESAPDFMKGIVGRLSDEACKIDAQDAQMEAFKSIAEYGSENFVVDTYGHQLSIEKGFNERMEYLSRERARLAEKMSPYLDSQEETKYFAEINKKEGELREELSKTTGPKELRNTIVRNAIKIIKGREEEAQ